MFALSSSLQPRVFIADGVDSSPTGCIFTYNTSSQSIHFNSSSCQHTLDEPNYQVQQHIVSVAVRNVVGVGASSAPVTIGMWKLVLLGRA